MYFSCFYYLLLLFWSFINNMKCFPHGFLLSENILEELRTVCGVESICHLVSKKA